jgi:hypothetical protein
LFPVMLVWVGSGERMGYGIGYHAVREPAGGGVEHLATGREQGEDVDTRGGHGGRGRSYSVGEVGGECIGCVTGGGVDMPVIDNLLSCCSI